MEKLVLIDGHSIINRAFYGVPDLTNTEGLHTNAIYGFLNILFKILEDEKPGYLAVAFDLKAPTFRHKMFDGYKGTRKPMPEELREQVPVMKEVLAAMGVPILTKEGYEADDILGTVAKRVQADGNEVTIVSGDRDLLQLADERIKIKIPKTSRGVTEVYEYYPEDVLREYQVTPQEFIDVKALMGDQSDNIPGVPSIGEKTATNLIREYHSLSAVYENLDTVKPPRAKKALTENKELADLSYALAKINIDSPVDFSLPDAKIGDFYTQEVYDWMNRLEFKSYIAKFGPEAGTGHDCEDGFEIVEDFKEAEERFRKAEQAGSCGAQLFLDDGKVFGLALCCDEKQSSLILCGGMLTEAYLCSRTEELGRKAKLTVLDLKSQLPYLHFDYEDTVCDLSIAAYLLNPLKDTYDADDLARDYLSLSIPSRAELIGKKNIGKAYEEDRKAVRRLCCFAAYTAFCAKEPVLKKLEEENMTSLYYDIELPLVYALYHMEEEGIEVRREDLHEYSRMLKEKVDALEKEIYELTGTEFNINSPKQLGEVLFEKMQIKGGKKTKTGYSTAADVLEKLAPDYPVVRKILDYRQVTKLKSTYADGLDVYIRDDNRIHSRFNQTITATGRISSTEPNLQNIPIRMELGRMIRKVFVPKEGYVFLDADYSQIELRVLAHMSGDERLITAYQEAQDIHAITASQVFHTPLSEVTPLQRRNAKAVNFGIVYGISAFGLSEDLSITRKEALEYINRYFETYPQVKTFLDSLVESAKETGYALTMYNRRRPVPELKSANFMQRSFGERVAMNSPIQGTAADIIKIAMIRVDRRLRKEGLSSRLILQIHDELLIETKKEELEEVQKILSEEMKNAAALKVSLEIDMHDGSNWFEAK